MIYYTGKSKSAYEYFKYKSDNEIGFNQKQFIKDTDRSLRELFKNEIKGSFLIRIYHNVLQKLGYNELLNEI